MKLWLLRPIEGDSLWEPWFDKTFGFVVRAKSERDARSLAQAESGGAETELWSADYKTHSKTDAWLSAKHSTCVELVPDGPREIVITDFHAA